MYVTLFASCLLILAFFFFADIAIERFKDRELNMSRLTWSLIFTICGGVLYFHPNVTGGLWLLFMLVISAMIRMYYLSNKLSK